MSPKMSKEKRIVISQPARAEDRRLPTPDDEVPRPKVLEALEESLLQYDDLYRRLAQ